MADGGCGVEFGLGADFVHGLAEAVGHSPPGDAVAVQHRVAGLGVVVAGLADAADGDDRPPLVNDVGACGELVRHREHVIVILDSSKGSKQK